MRQDSPLGLNPVDITGYHPPWKSLTEFAVLRPGELGDPGGPHYGALVSQMHGYPDPGPGYHPGHTPGPDLYPGPHPDLPLMPGPPGMLAFPGEPGGPPPYQLEPGPSEEFCPGGPTFPDQTDCSKAQRRNMDYGQ